MSNSPKQDFSLEWKDDNSGVSTPQQVVARTQEEWEEIWSAAHSKYMPAPEAPKLPEGKMALCIFTGTSNAPSDISVLKVEQKGSETIVTWSAEVQRNMMAVMNSSCLLKLVDKTDTPVVFQKAEPKPPFTSEQKFKP